MQVKNLFVILSEIEIKDIYISKLHQGLVNILAVMVPELHFKRKAEKSEVLREHMVVLFS